MRKLILALTALVCSVGVVAAQQAPTSNIGNFPAVQPVSQSGAWTFGLNGPIPAGSNTIGSVNVLGGNAVAVKTDGSATVQPVSSATLSTAANQATEIAALGTPSDTAYTGSGAASIIAALKGLYTALLAPTPAGTNVIGKVGLDQTTPGTTNGVVVNSSALPAGGATAANQTSEIAQLTAANQRTAFYVDYGPGSLAAGASAANNAYDAGANPAPYTKFNATFASTQAITAIVQGSYDGATFFEVFSGAVPAPPTGSTYGALNVTVPVTLRYYRTKIIGNASAAATVLVTHSYSTN